MPLKSLLRDSLVFFAALFTLPLWSCARIERMLGNSDGLFVSCGQFLGMFPGVLGIYLRRGYYWMVLDSFSRDCSIGFGTWFSHSQCNVGSRVYIGARCIVGTCAIGDNVLIGSNVDILSGRRQHRFTDESRPICEQGGEFAKISIGNNSWIGNSSVIMAEVGENSIIGAGSVVAKAIPPNSVAVGNPATVHRTREPDWRAPAQIEEHSS
jgi:acetyltransferase-like isoleucine patch superfamily enzyme